MNDTARTTDSIIEQIDIRDQGKIVGGWMKLANGDECGWYAPYIPLIDRGVRESFLDTAQSTTSIADMVRWPSGNLIHRSVPDYLAITRGIVESQQ